MAPLVDIVPATLAAIKEGVNAWREYKKNDSEHESDKDKAIASVMAAAIATKAYLYDSLETGGISRDREHKLSLKWQEAAGAIRKFDKNLFFSSQVKALGWADPREWEKAKDKAVTVNLDLIIEQCEYHQKN